MPTRPKTKKTKKTKRKAPAKKKNEARALGWGGARPGAGRKKDPKNVGRAPHVARPEYRPGSRLRVELVAKDDAPSLKNPRVHATVLEELARGATKDFRIFSSDVGDRRIALVVAADDAGALGRGMQRIGSRIARQVNAILNRTGTLWKDRYAIGAEQARGRAAAPRRRGR